MSDWLKSTLNHAEQDLQQEAEEKARVEQEHFSTWELHRAAITRQESHYLEQLQPIVDLIEPLNQDLRDNGYIVQTPNNSYTFLPDYVSLQSFRDLLPMCTPLTKVLRSQCDFNEWQNNYHHFGLKYTCSHTPTSPYSSGWIGDISIHVLLQQSVSAANKALERGEAVFVPDSSQIAIKFGCPTRKTIDDGIIYFPNLSQKIKIVFQISGLPPIRPEFYTHPELQELLKSVIGAWVYTHRTGKSTEEDIAKIAKSIEKRNPDKKGKKRFGFL